MVIALAGFVTAGVLPAAGAPSTVEYVALGDSYAAGTAIHSDCPSPDGYPALLDLESIRISLMANAACSGATTSDVLGQLSALERDTRLVTLTVGAANLGLSAVATACISGTPLECQQAIGQAQALLRDCPEDEHSVDCSLIPLFAQVAREARGARIVVTGYPLLFECARCAPGDPRADINQATTRLNSLIERAVTATQATYANIYYVDVTDEFAKHGIVTPITDPDAFIHSQFTCDPPRPDCRDLDLEAFHPTLAGYQAYADAISAVLPAGWLDKP